MKTIAIVSNTSWYIYNFRTNTILTLIKLGYNVVVISTRDAYSEKLKFLGAEFYSLNLDSSGLNPLKDLKAIFDLYKILKKSKADVVLNFTPKINIYSTLAAKILKLKIINNIAGLGTVFVTNSILSIGVRFLYKISQKHADFIFFQNEDDRRIFLDGNIIDVNRTDRLPGSGVDLNRFRINLKVDGESTRSFLLVCRMLRQKGVVDFMKAAEILKNKYADTVNFNMLGFIDENNPSYIHLSEMKYWIDKGFVSYLGTSDEIENVISNHDCVVLPSFYREGVPKSLLEAGAMGKPIVTTDNVGCRDAVDDGINGFLCTPNDYLDLANKMEKIIVMTNKDIVAFGLSSRKKIENEFDEKIVVNKYVKKIDELLHS